MAINESVDEYWNSEFTSSERQFFQKCARTLLKKTFIVRDKDEENRKMFYFVSKNSDFFSHYFSFMGFEVLVQKDSGVVMLSNIVNENISASVAVNRFRFKKIESIVLCCLWTLLSDRLHRGSLDKVIKITLSDLNMELEKYDFKKTFDKGPLSDILKLFCKFNLIGTSGEIGEEDFCIILYPSLQFALNESEFVSFVKDAEKRMKGNEDEGLETDNIMDENEADEPEIDPFDVEIEEGEDN
ncbi:MAG: DUF4194 domain-containing protein [Treponema sp.]|nr:DUF4194 domain-containing protein [Treponema sp.]